MSASYIDDGYTLTATIPAHSTRKRVKAFSMTYRPMLTTQRNVLFNGTRRAAELADFALMSEWEGRVVKALAEHVVSWELKDRKGECVKPSEDALRRLDPEQFEHVYNFIGNYAVPPEEGEDSQAAADAKNS